MTRTTWGLALVALLGLLIAALAIGLACTPEGGIGTAGGFVAMWAGLMLIGKATP